MDQKQHIEQLYARRDWIDGKISEVKHWGALLTALNDERSGIEKALIALEADERKRRIFPRRERLGDEDNVVYTKCGIGG